jgi:hypothetical protein
MTLCDQFSTPPIIDMTSKAGQGFGAKWDAIEPALTPWM